MKHDHRERLMMAHAVMSARPEQCLAPDTDIVKANVNIANARIGNTTDRSSNPAQANQNASPREFKLHELTMLSLGPIFRSIHRWWLERAEHHYLICADVEEQRAREAQLNVAYYQKRAAMARSARL